MKKNPFRVFNVNEFKKWMEDSGRGPEGDSTIGLKATSKVSFKKLKTVSEVLDSVEALSDFFKHGGTVIEEDNETLTVRTEKGNIKIRKNYTIIS